MARDSEQHARTADLVSEKIGYLRALGGEERTRAVMTLANTAADSGAVEETIELLERPELAKLAEVERWEILARAHREQASHGSAIVQLYYQIPANDPMRIHAAATAEQEMAEVQLAINEAQRLESLVIQHRIDYASNGH